MQIAPSLLAANASRYREELEEIEHGGAEALHIDVMDGHFVPNLSFGPNIVAALRPVTKLFFDVHLMIEHPAQYAKAFIDAGADAITIHAECADAWEDVYGICQSAGVGFGLALCPATPVACLRDWLPRLSILLIMSIQPGFGGQRFLPEALTRIAEAKSMRDAAKSTCIISVDGGVCASNADACRMAGADMLVAGSAVFGAKDRAAVIEQLRRGGNGHDGEN